MASVNDGQKIHDWGLISRYVSALSGLCEQEIMLTVFKVHSDSVDEITEKHAQCSEEPHKTALTKCSRNVSNSADAFWYRIKSP